MRVRLEPLRQVHAQALYPVLSDPELYRHLDHGPPPNPEHLHDVFARLEQGRSPDGSEQWLNWVLFADEGADALGTLQATVYADGRAWVAWVAWVLARRVWGRGLAREAATLVLSHLRRGGVRRALACVEQANDRSNALAARLGFRAGTADEHAAQGLGPTERLWVLDLGPP